LEDLAAQLAEFELRCAGEDYDTAAAVLLEIDYDYLILWGHYRLVTDLHERLQGNIGGWKLCQCSVGNLGTAYCRLGQYKRTIACYEQALTLARDQKDRWGEGVWLGNLGYCYAELGQSGQAIEYHEQALGIAREIGNRVGEATGLGNIGGQYANLGQTTRAIEYKEQSLAIDRELKDRPGEALDLCNLGSQYANLGRTAIALQCLKDTLAIAWEIGFRLIEAAARTFMGHVYLDQDASGEAFQAFKQAIEIADDTANTQFQLEARLGLAQANLYQSEFAAAREMAEAARQYNCPLSNHTISAVLGVAALRLGDVVAAREAFATALNQARELLARSPQFYAALDTKGLALCGLVLCGNPDHIPKAKEAYKAARTINSDAGVVGRVLRLFDALAKADAAGILAEVRTEAARVQIKVSG
jgi:tetratricopeptide (TPR) repeat protein